MWSTKRDGGVIIPEDFSVHASSDRVQLTIHHLDGSVAMLFGRRSPFFTSLLFALSSVYDGDRPQEAN